MFVGIRELVSPINCECIPHYVIDEYQMLHSQYTSLAVLNLHTMKQYILPNKQDAYEYQFFISNPSNESQILRDLGVMSLNQHFLTSNKRSSENTVVWRFHYKERLVAFNELVAVYEDGFVAKPINATQTNFFKFRHIRYSSPEDGMTAFAISDMHDVFVKQVDMPNFDEFDNFTLFMIKYSQAEIEQLKERQREIESLNKEQIIKIAKQHIEASNHLTFNGFMFETNVDIMVRKLELGL